MLPNFSVAISSYDLFRKQFHPWRATWRHDKRVLPNFSVAISLNYFTFIFPENNFIREERLDVTLSGCCQISSFPFLAIILLLPFPKTISSMKSNLTSRQLGAAKFFRCHFWQLLYFYLFRKQFHSWRATWRHGNWVLPSFSVAISGNYFTFIFSENNFVGEERLDVTTTGCCQTSTLPFLAITLLLSFPKTSSSVKSDLTSRQLGAAKLLRCHFWLWSFPKTISSVKSNLTSRQLGAAKLLRCHFWLWSFPKTFSSVKSNLTSRQLGAARLLRCHCWQLFYFYLFRKQFRRWRATWRHDNWVLPNFYVAISGNYFTFIFSGNIFIREERLDVTTTGCCQTSTLPLLAIILLLSFPKLISSVKSDLTSRQLGAAKLLRCHFWQLLYFYLFRKLLHPWRATWRPDNWELPNFYVAISGYDLFRKQFHPSRATWRHDNWELPNFYVAISGYDLFRKHFHPWRATWRHDNWVLPDFYVAISVNYFTFIFSGNIFIREERLDVTTTGCCQTSTLPLLAMIFSENNFIREGRLDVTTTGCCQTSPLPFHSITLLLSFPKTISSVKSDLTSR